jgi:hypothetical protein
MMAQTNKEITNMKSKTNVTVLRTMLVQSCTTKVRAASVESPGVIGGSAAQARQKNKKTCLPFPVITGFFFLGAALWSVPAFLLALIGTIHLTEALKGGLVMCIVAAVAGLILVAMKGWDRKFFNQRPGSYDPFYKFIIIFLISVSVIGNVWVFFWTGRGILRLLGTLTGRK